MPSILAPAEGTWKHALVYALDLRLRPPGELVVYFNARDGWLFGKERIGLATARLPGGADGPT